MGIPLRLVIGADDARICSMMSMETKIWTIGGHDYEVSVVSDREVRRGAHVSARAVRYGDVWVAIEPAVLTRS